MGSKLILLLSLLAGAFLTYTCVNENRDHLLAKYDQLSGEITSTQTSAKPEPKSIPKSEPVPIPEPIQTIELIQPMFIYSTKENRQLSAKLSINDKNEILEQFILEYCQSDSCTQDLSFDENIDDASWQNEAIKIASFLKDKSIKNGVISIDGYLVKLEGELNNNKEAKALNTLLESFDSKIFEVKNLTTIAPNLKIIKSTQETKEKPEIEITKVPEVTEEKIVKKPVVIETTQNEVNQLLEANPIYFKFNSDTISTKSKSILDKIITTVKKLNNISLTIEGHTDSRGDATYNKILSQKRADAVKQYFLDNGLKKLQIEAIGYGEERPIYENPSNTINRRVEIHLKEGE